MRQVLFILFLLFSLPAFAYHPDATELRALYYKAPENKEATEKFLEVIEQVKQDTDPVIRCYKGMALMLKANYCLNPYHKFSYFNKGRALVDQAVKQSPQNLEIRFLRFCAQTNAPSFLGYNDDINTDKATILKSWHTLSDHDLKMKIKQYLVESGYCSKDERSILL